jgi:hypothetical protein
VAKVIPLFKSGDVMKINNYRPVSILPVFSKVLERLMYNRLFSFIEKFKILYDFQFGFRKKHSSYMALLIVVDKIVKSLEKGEVTVGLYLDFSKAFDTINHEILFEKLHHYGVRGTALCWLKSYMLNRYQYVHFNGQNSSKKMIVCGVPQGSILGPLLFLLYVNDLAFVSNYFTSVLFADDTNMFSSSSDMTFLQTKCNTELKNISLWLQVNKLSLNIDKSQFMLFAGRKKIDNFNLEINGIKLGRVAYVKFLGVIFDDKLSFKSHTDHICKKISKSTGILCKLRQYVRKDTLINLYYSLVFPYISYCNIVWGNAYSSILKPLVILQKRVIRIISFAPRLAHSAPIFQRHNILKTSLVYKYSICLFMFNMINGDIPDYFSSLFSTHDEFHNHFTRNRNNLCLPLFRLDISRRFISYSLPAIWNEVQSELNINCTSFSFKRNLKRFLINTY